MKKKRGETDKFMNRRRARHFCCLSLLRRRLTKNNWNGVNRLTFLFNRPLHYRFLEVSEAWKWRFNKLKTGSCWKDVGERKQVLLWNSIGQTWHPWQDLQERDIWFLWTKNFVVLTLKLSISSSTRKQFKLDTHKLVLLKMANDEADAQRSRKAKDEFQDKDAALEPWEIGREEKAGQFLHSVKIPSSFSTRRISLNFI